MGSSNVVPLSVIIPSMGRPKELARALASIAEQPASPSEIIVVDDGSEPALSIDKTVISRLAVRLVRHGTNRGPAAARNTGIAAASSDWIAFLDCDDVLLPNTLGSRWDFVSKSAQSDRGKILYGCGWTEWSDGQAGHTVRIPKPSNGPRSFASGCWFSPGSCIIMNRAAVLAEGISQDETLRRFEDLDWFLALGLRGFELKVQPIVGVGIERRRVQNPASVELIARAIVEKWRANALPADLLRRLSAYLNLECAAANYFAGRRLQAAVFLAKSLLQAPRTSLHLSPGWEPPTSGV